MDAYLGAVRCGAGRGLSDMRIQLKLFATLGDYLPAGARRNVADVEVPDGATPHQVIDLFGIPGEQAHLVVLNGTYVLPHQRDGLRLAADDSRALWSPVAGRRSPVAGG